MIDDAGDKWQASQRLGYSVQGMDDAVPIVNVEFTHVKSGRTVVGRVDALRQMSDDELRAALRDALCQHEEELLVRQMREAVSKTRRYAGFFDWPDKNQKEAGILESFQEALADQYDRLCLTSARIAEIDPPDAWVESAADGPIGIEITEFVDGDLAGAQEHIPYALYRNWTVDEFREKLSISYGVKIRRRSRTLPCSAKDIGSSSTPLK